MMRAKTEKKTMTGGAESPFAALSFHPMDEKSALEIIGWRYPPPFDFYNASATIPKAVFIRGFLDPELQFHRMVDGDGKLVGFCSFGPDGRVPGGDYSASALDIGLGMRPDLTGQGRGGQFFERIEEFAIRKYRPRALRLSVAAFNQRAMRVYCEAGFKEIQRFRQTDTRTPFAVLTKRVDP